MAEGECAGDNKSELENPKLTLIRWDDCTFGEEIRVRTTKTANECKYFGNSRSNNPWTKMRLGRNSTFRPPEGGPGRVFGPIIVARIGTPSGTGWNTEGERRQMRTDRQKKRGGEGPGRKK